MLAQCSMAFAQSKPEGDITVGGNLEGWKLVVSVIGLIITAIELIGAAIAFFIGLKQYDRAQKWKRAEFLANEMKDLLADPKAVNALTMIDWGARRIKLHGVEDDPARNKRTLVTYRMQCSALMPHTFESSQVSSGAPEVVENSDAAGDGSALRTFLPEEALIRDCYDALLDRLDRLGAYLEARLMSASDMKPYVGYYIDEIAAQTRDPTEALWNVTFLAYVHFYHFSGIPILFEKFGHDISPDGLIFKNLLDNVGYDDRKLAKKL